MIEIPVTFEEESEFDVAFEEDSEFDVEFGGVSKEDYHGEYVVTPTEEIHTLLTTDKLLSQNIVVEAIPSNYVGTGIGRRDEDDILFNDGMVGVTSGYYQSNTVKQIPSASIYGGYDAVVTPSITVNESGLITVGILEEQDFAFCFGSGWVNTSASTDIRVQGYNTLQLTNGNNLEYGLTDATSSRVGVGKVGSMIIK